MASPLPPLPSIRRAPAFPAIALAFAVLTAPLSAHSDSGKPDPVPAKARTLADRGRAAHDAGDYASAITAFTQAYVMAPSAGLLFNLAQAYRLQGNCDDAALMYRRYLAANPSADGRVLAESHLAAVERCMRKISLHIPVETPSGRVIRPATPFGASITAKAEPKRGELQKDIGIGLVAGGGIALAVATYYAVQAHSASNDVADAYENGARWEDIAPLDQRGKTAATRAKVLGVGGAFGVATGAVMYMIGRSRANAPLVVAPTKGGVEMSMSWSF